jgi:hypothetical protein
LQFLRDNPIDHPFYRSFMDHATKVVSSHATQAS